MSERSRSTMYQTCAPMLGEEVIGEMLSYFPARDAEEPATKEFVRAEVADVRAEIAGVRSEIAQLRAELLVTIHDEFRRQLQWLVGTFVLLTGVMLAGVRLFAA